MFWKTLWTWQEPTTEEPKSGFFWAEMVFGAGSMFMTIVIHTNTQIQSGK